METLIDIRAERFVYPGQAESYTPELQALYSHRSHGQSDALCRVLLFLYKDHLNCPFISPKWSEPKWKQSSALFSKS